MRFFASALILSADVKDTISIDIESHFNLRCASRCGGDPIQTEVSECLVIFSHRALTLKYLDVHCSLIVCIRRECLALFGRNRSVALNHGSCHATCSFDC